MIDDPRLDTLLNALLDSHATPEEVCSDCPELLPQLRRRWQEIHRVRADLDLLFPPSNDAGVHPSARVWEDAATPRLPGYEIQAVLGRGGMGVVYRARHLRLNRAVAVKMLLAGPYALPAEAKRFVLEAETVAGLHHPNIVQVYDVGDVEGRPYFTMEHMEGGSLAQKLAGAPLPAFESAALVATVAGAVHAAHQCGIIHRDLKPANILLTRDGTPKVSDFGLARRMESGIDLTMTGAAPLGTPSYMAPEQIRGEKGVIGPAVDVYALGTILYELLTGRPPFRSETQTATLQQVLTEEPAPPARLNSRVPRDLETICMKCLRKEPQRRYASAALLAEDLRRFECGEPITARPMGVVERAARWLWRRPALVTALVAGMVLVLTFTCAGVWAYQQSTAAAHATAVDVEVELRNAEQFRQNGEYLRAADALQRAKLRLGDGPAALRERLGKESTILKLVRHLDTILMERVLVKPWVQPEATLLKAVTEQADNGDAMRSGKPPGRRYEEAFRNAELGVPGDDPAMVAKRVRASPIHAALVSALDDWSACAVDLNQQAWVLKVVRLADPDPWRNRVRDPVMWDDREALIELAAAAPVAEQSPQLLVVLGARLRVRGGDARPFMTSVVLAHPTDFWANVEMGTTIWQQDPLEAIGYFRTALAIRPGTASLHRNIAVLYRDQNRLAESIPHYREAARLDPFDPWYYNSLGGVLLKVGRREEAIAEFHKALRIDSNYAWAHNGLAVAYQKEGRLAEAVDECREALRLRPQYYEAQQGLHYLLRYLGRWSELRVAWQKDLAANPPKHGPWFGYAELCLYLGEEEEYQSARRDLLARFGDSTDPQVAERTGRASLLLKASVEELRQAAALTERAVAAGRSGNEFAYPYFLFANGLKEYRQRRFDDAIKTMTGEAAKVMGPCPRLIEAMALHQKGRTDEARKTLETAINSYNWSPEQAVDHDAWIAHILRREAETMILESAISR